MNQARRPRDPGAAARGAWRAPVLRTFRAAVLVGAVALVHWHHRLVATSDRAAPDLAIADVQVVVPAAAGLGAPRPGDDGRRPILDADGREIGSTLQTAPESDPVIGYAGSTNTLLVFDDAERLAAFRILASGDTAEHVERVRADRAFAEALHGRSPDELADPGLVSRIDAVSGATLTSTSMLRGIVARLGSPGAEPPASALFRNEVPLDAVRRIYPDAAAFESLAPGSFAVHSAAGARLGTVVRTSPAADALLGYRGPTEALVGIDLDDRIAGFTLLESFDSPEYVDDVTAEPHFMETFDGRPLAEVAGLDVKAAGIEGVSGATLTSWAVAQGIADRLATFPDDRHEEAHDRSWLRDVGVHEWGTLAVVVVAIAAVMTPLGTRRWFRLPFQLVLVGYLGLTAGNLVAMSLVVGWSRSGIPWTLAPGLALLAVSALAVPWATGRNVYCHHLCPHGAAQQLVRRVSPWRRRTLTLPAKLERLLRRVPGASLLAVFALAVAGTAVPLTSIEPFHAYVIRVAGAASITLALLGLALSLWIPLPYCRFGCPTGALIDLVGSRGAADRFSRRDAVAVAALAAALAFGWLRAQGTLP